MVECGSLIFKLPKLKGDFKMSKEQEVHFVRFIPQNGIWEGNVLVASIQGFYNNLSKQLRWWNERIPTLFMPPEAANIAAEKYGWQVLPELPMHFFGKSLDTKFRTEPIGRENCFLFIRQWGLVSQHLCRGRNGGIVWGSDINEAIPFSQEQTTDITSVYLKK